jgi:uncharacterized protein with FMN-binding domain
MIVLALVVSLAAGADIEFLDGKKITCRTLSKTTTHLKVEVQIDGKKVVRQYELAKIHKVTIGDKVHIVNPKDDSARPGPPAVGEPVVLRTAAEVKKLIDEQGRTPPDWFDSTLLNYPETLDLSYPPQPEGGWNNQKNVGQFVWDIINPNPSRWREGVRLMHHLLSLNPDDKARRNRVMRDLGGMYFRFFQDYPRAAFWWLQANVGTRQANSVALAECYWRMGNKQMAMQTLDTRRIGIDTIKLLGDMRETRRALQLADAYIARARQPQEGLIVAGDACRLAGNYQKAIRYYERVLATDRMDNPDYDKRMRDRATESIEAIKLFELSDVKRVADGTYPGSSLGYEGQIEVEVVVKDRLIEDVRVTKHKEKQFYSALTDVPAQIIRKQGVKGVDATSRATITAEAIINATAKALAKGAGN